MSMAFQVCYPFDFKFAVFPFNNHFKFYINSLMKIHENFHVIRVFHHDKSNRRKVYTRIYLVSMFFRFVELCSARNQCICFQIILFLFISNSEYMKRYQYDKKVTTCQNFKIDGLSQNKPSRSFYNKFVCLNPSCLCYFLILQSVRY